MAANLQDSLRPLNVAIVGAGIGGLAAAIALRRNGHHVRIFEASQKKTEIGAGVGVQTNAVRILKQFGYSLENLKPLAFDGAVIFDAKNGIGITRPWLIAHESIVCHRSDLHDELIRLATGESGGGPPVQLLLNSKVATCDADGGIVTLADGEIVHADIVIGADGIHSVVRTSVLGHAIKPPASGWTCFRCLFDASTLDELTDLEWLTEGLHGARSVIMREKEFRMFFIYPCRSGTLINFVAIYPDGEQDAADWTPTANLDEVREKYTDFHPKFLRILDLPLHTPILKWQLRAVPILPTWIRGRAALLGDAAHATLPLLGQGAAMAIEEAAVLACLLPLGTTKEDIPARLEAYQTLRKERGEFVGMESVSQAAVPVKRGQYLRSREMQMSMLDYDAVQVAQDYYDANVRGIED
ncbi:FAD/NAD(P)-binding domain-containing protein [Mycena albidolilacea]|uniref:FAD/NAD(P)-binding domain-containing protein n=1 Tax=Mycena albidolilacea TaxID=1033008 RepID=A0AAD7E7A4_9AGAR|nr:FAD/NAD(P)-binding domain-containing protein [Mycena albidolilacea]